MKLRHLLKAEKVGTFKNHSTRSNCEHFFDLVDQFLVGFNLDVVTCFIVNGDVI